MLAIGIARIGNEPVVRFTTAGKPALQLSLAYQFGRKNDQGEYPTQWVDATMWGERTEKLAPMLKKGDRIYVELRDVHMDSFTRKDGSPGSNIKATIEKIEFIESRKQEQRPALTQPKNSVVDMPDDPIPF